MPAALVKSIAEKQGVSLAEAERRWAKAKDITLSETDLTEGDGDKFWAYVTGVFKRSIGITESILESGTSYMQRLSGAEMVMPAQDNLQWVLKRRMNYTDAMYRPDTGWISFLWGRAGFESSDYMDGYGIANILAKDSHNAGTEDRLMQAAEILARGRIRRKYGPPGNRRIDITWRGDIARLAWHRGRKTWYLAGWPGLIAEEPEEDQVVESAKIDREANKAASSPKNSEPEPTEAQKKSGNYKKGHAKIIGLDIAIENPAGSERSGTDRNGKKWTSKIHHHYGYIKGTVGKDKDHIDVFLGSEPEKADKVFVVNQVNPGTGKFDEHKVMLGFEDEKEAKAAYLSNYEKGWKGLGSICTLWVDEFKDWLKNGDTKKAVERGETGSYRVDPVLESAPPSWKQAILNSKTFDDIRTVFVQVFPDVPEKGIMESGIFEMAVDPAEIATSNWERAIERADDIDDISNIFKMLFAVRADADASPYFESTDRSILMPIDKLVRREAPDSKRVEHAHEYMNDTKAGTGTKRKPINVLAMGNGKYKILDGNTTLHALKDMGETKAVVEIKRTLKQPGVETIDDLYKQAEEAQPLFLEYMKKWGEKTGGEVMVRPGLKSKERSIEKVKADQNGTFAGLKDILAGTLVFDTVYQVAAAVRLIENDDSVFRVKNRYEKPMKSGYRDIFMNVALPNGHIAELQLNTQSMIDAKEKGLGHKIYDITRVLRPISKEKTGDIRFIARGAMEELNDLSQKVYDEAAIRASSARSLAKASAKALASNSEMDEAWDSILTQLSESSISTHLEGSLPSIRKSDQESKSLANGTSSFSMNSNAIKSPPEDAENIADLPENVKILKGKIGSAFLYDNTSFGIQYAVIDISDVKTSHTETLAKNDSYPQEIQPRQRDRDAMRLQVDEMANKLNPVRMGESPLASTGAPIVGPDLAVESGNGRTIALRKAYHGAKGEEYKAWLIENASNFGIAPGGVESIETPMLVRVRTTPIEDRAKFAEDANKDEIARMSPAELARMDAENLTDADLGLFAPSEDGNIAASSNQDFIQRFISKLGVNESSGYLTADGRPTKQLIDRIQAAIFQKAYQDDSLLSLMAEESDPKLRNVLNALTFSATEFAKCRSFDDNLGGINIPSHAIAAGNLIRKCRDDKMHIEELLSQIGMFEQIPEGTAEFARFINDHIRSGKRMGLVFREAAKLLKGYLSDLGQEALFEPEPAPTPSEIIQRAIKAVEDEYYGGRQKGLFENAGDHETGRGEGESDGTGRAENDVAGETILEETRGGGESIVEGAISNMVVVIIDKIAPKYLANKNIDLFKRLAVDLAKRGLNISAISGELVAEGFPKNAVTAFLKEFSMETGKNSIFEASMAVPWKADIMGATSINDIISVFSRLFGLAVQKVKESLIDYQNENSDYGLKVRGIKARERLNEQARETISRVADAGKLTQEEIAILKQYSGKGGLTENSQYEYYTPTHVAEGVWDAMKANGFENGNVLDPCTGAGVFEGTKPKGIVMTGCDLDPIGSQIAQLLNPKDLIQGKPFEQLVMETPDNTFDGCITNVPFGDARGACAHDDPAYKDEKRIERYFILRALDKIKPGKLACFVVPANIVGAKGGKWAQFRTAVSKKAEFLGAHKLPSKTFSAQGTDTVVDVVVFKKHPEEFLEKMDSLHTETLRETNVLWDQFIDGEYWKGEGRKFIMGKWVPKIEGDRWSRETVDGDVDNEGLKRKLAMRFDSRIDWDALETAAPTVKNYAEGDRRVINGEEYELKAGDWVKVHKAETGDSMVLEVAKYGAASYGELESLLGSPKGALKLTAQQAFAAWKVFPNLMTPLQKGAVEFAMSQPKDEYREQMWRGSIIGGMIGRLQAIETEDNPDGDADAMRQELQELVASEVARYGHPKNNKGLILTGESSRTFGLFVNAMDEAGNFSDLLSGNIVQDFIQFDATNIQSIVEHLFLREGIQNIELEDVQKLYAGKRKVESLGDIAEDDGIAVTSDGMIMPLGRYCSGDIYSKMQAMTKAMADEPDQRIKAKYQKQIDLIMQRRKTTIAPDIVFGLQQKWFSRKYIVDFLKANGYPRMDYGVFKEVETEDAVSGEITKEQKLVKDYDDPFGHFYGYEEASGWLAQFNKYLNGKNVTSSKKETKEGYQKNTKALEEQFNVWMQQHPDIDQITEKYNQKFNGYLAYEYGNEDLKLEGVSPQVELHGFQSAAIQRLSEEGRGCLALDVGLGKTYGALGLYAYNKQMGRSKKTCIVVPNAVLANWYHSSKKFLGNHDNVLTVGFKPKIGKNGTIAQEVVKDEKGQPKKNKHTGEQEYRDALIRTDSKEEVWEDMWKIPQGNYSLVIMTKEKFGTIPMRPSTKRGFTDKMVERSLISEKQADATVNENSHGRAVSYQEDKDKLNLEQKFSDEGTRKKGELPFFEDMGFTDVIVDECHEFKNSYSAGEQTQNIAYLPTAPSAKRALDMAMKMNYLREANNGRGPYLLSATPVTNSPFEIYNILSLCCPIEEFERFGVYTVDDFVRVFGDIQTVDKVKVSGEVTSMDGLVGFQNLDGLRNLFHKYVIMKNAQDVNLPLPPHDEHQDMVDLSEEQTLLYSGLRARAKEAAKPGSDESMFAVMRDMDRVTTDMDLYYHTMTFHFPAKHKAKVDAIIDKLPDEITTTIQEEGERVKQHIPLTTETRMEGDTYVLVVPEAYEELVVSKFPEMNIEETEVGHPVTPKYAKLVERLRKHFEENGKQLIFTEEKSQHEKVRRLIIHEVPVWKDVIGVINADTANGAKLQNISNLYNSGTLKIIVANKKAEVGVNLQKGTTAVHHLTLPWTPASIQQRNGRGVRQGNTAEHIDIYYYLGKGSFDQYRLDLLQKKSNWMNDLFKGQEAKAENANAFQQDEYVDMLEDDPEEAKKRRLERLAKKAAERKAREDMISANMLQQLANNSHILKNLDSDKKKVRADLEKKIPEQETKLANYEKRIAEVTEPEQKAQLRDRAEKAKRALDNYKLRLKGLDASYAARKTELEARNKQNSGLLKHRAKKEGLPFDESLIDHPGNAIVSLNGLVVAKGDFYEVIGAADEDRPANRFRKVYGGHLLQITDVNPVDRWLTFEPVLGGYISLPTEYNREAEKTVTPINQWPAKDLKKVSYSADEIALKKMLAEQFAYADLIEGSISKDLFYDHIDEINLHLHGSYLVRTGKGLEVLSLSQIESRKNIVYPEPQNEDFRKEVCEMYLALSRAGEDGWDVDSMMQDLFGENWHDTALQYGRKATESQIREAAAKAVEAYRAEHLQGKDDPEEMEAYWRELRYRDGDIIQSVRDALNVDNTDDIVKITSSCIETETIQAERDIKRLQEEAERKELEEIRNHPNYKEIPANIAEAFREIGITVKTNMSNMVIPGFKGRRGTSVEPFQKWYFQDEKGKGGRLFRVKEILKSRYGAGFFSNADDVFTGAWWHVPSTVDLKEVYELLA